ncbi:MAG: hypothetical protein JWM53_6773 [bacterium]|nr:hypothetical protein [bacterium]
MKRFGFIALALASLPLVSAGCSGRDGARDAGDAVRGLVRVDLSYTHVAGTTAINDIRFDAQARFVRYRSFDAASVPTILGFADFDGVPLDSCKVFDGTAELDSALAADTVAPTAEVSLLDAGHLEMRGPIDRAAFSARHYPELVPFVSGVVYGGEETSPIALGLGQPYQVAGEGGNEVGPFSATVTAPRSFPTLQVEVLHRGSDLDVRWSSEGQPTGEPLVLEARWSSRAGMRTVRCRVRDDGAFSIPHDSFADLPATSALSSATVTATRLARAPFFAPGAGRGELTLSLKDVAALVVTP